MEETGAAHSVPFFFFPCSVSFFKILHKSRGTYQVRNASPLVPINKSVQKPKLAFSYEGTEYLSGYNWIFAV